MNAAKLFSERQAFWVGKGLAGRAVFDALATDSELPSFFDEPAVAAIYGLSTHAMRQRRNRKMPPAYIALSSRCVRYPRQSVCFALAEMFAGGDK